MATTAPNTTSIAPGLPGGADPAMTGIGNPRVSQAGTVIGQQPGLPPAPVAPSYQTNGYLNNGNNPVKTAPAPAVVTATPAIQDANAKMATVNNLAATQVTAPQPMATLVNATTGDRKAVPVGSQQAQGLFGQGYVLETKGAPTPTTSTTGTVTGVTPGLTPGLTPPPTAPVAPDTTTETNQNIADFKASMEETNAKADAAFNDYQNSVNQIRNGTFPLSPDQQAQIDQITQQYQNLIADQKIANRNYEGAVRQAGISAGRNMYAPEVELGNINAAIAAGARTIADINAKMASAITTAKLAFQESNFKLLDSVYSKLQEHLKDQKETIKDTYDKVKDALDAAQTKFTNDMATAQFEFQRVQELNKPILEADARLKDYLYEQMQKYGDAGITADDTVESAVEKIKNSKTYKDEQENIRLAQEAAKASIDASKASTAASYASAAKSRAELAALNAPGTLTQTERKQIAESKDAQKIDAGRRLQLKLDEYRKNVKKYGIEAIGQGAAELNSSYRDLQIAYKDAAALGALSASDLEILEGAIRPAAGIWAKTKQIASLGFAGPGAVIKSIDSVSNNVKKDVAQSQNNLKEQWGEQNAADDPYLSRYTDDRVYNIQEGKYSVTDPNGTVHSFGTQKELDEFKKAAKLQ